MADQEPFFTQDRLTDIGLGIGTGLAGSSNEGLSAAGKAMQGTLGAQMLREAESRSERREIEREQRAEDRDRRQREELQNEWKKYLDMKAATVSRGLAGQREADKAIAQTLGGDKLKIVGPPPIDPYAWERITGKKRVSRPEDKPCAPESEECIDESISAADPFLEMQASGEAARQERYAREKAKQQEQFMLLKRAGIIK
jgi:hypothetical protein